MFTLLILFELTGAGVVTFKRWWWLLEGGSFEIVPNFRCSSRDWAEIKWPDWRPPASALPGSPFICVHSLREKTSHVCKRFWGIHTHSFYRLLMSHCFVHNIALPNSYEDKRGHNCSRVSEQGQPQPWSQCFDTGTCASVVAFVKGSSFCCKIGSRLWLCLLTHCWSKCIAAVIFEHVTMLW